MLKAAGSSLQNRRPIQSSSRPVPAREIIFPLGTDGFSFAWEEEERGYENQIWKRSRKTEKFLEER
jgi:hypothetical protein